MIELTRLNGHGILVNCELIKYVEAAPDTTLSLTTGDKLLVLESPDQIASQIQHYRAATLRHAWPEPRF